MKEMYPAFHLHIISFHGPQLYTWSLSWRRSILPSTYTFLFMAHVIPLVANMKELYPAFHLHIIPFHGPPYTSGRYHERAVPCLPLQQYSFSWPTLYSWLLSWRSCILASTYTLFLFMAHVIPLVAIMKKLYPAFHLHIISFHGPRYTPGRYHEGAVSCVPLTHYFFSWPTIINLVAVMKELYPAFHLHIPFHGPRYTPGRCNEGALSCLPLTHYFSSWHTLYPWSLSWRSCILPSSYTLFLFMAHVIPLVAIIKELYPAFLLHIISFHDTRYTPGRYHEGAVSCLPLTHNFFSWPTLCQGRYHEGAVSCLPLTHYFFSWPTLYPWSLSWRSCILPSTYTLLLIMTHVIHLVAIMKELYPAFHLHIISFHDPRYTPGRCHEGAVSCLPLTHYFSSWPTLYTWPLSWKCCTLPSTYTFHFMAHVIHHVAIMKELYSAFHLHIILFHGPRYTPGRYHEGAVSCIPLTHYFFSWPMLPLVAIMKELYPNFHLHVISFHGPRYTPGRYHGGAVSCLPLKHCFPSWPTLYPWSLRWRSCILPSIYTLIIFMAHIIPLVAIMMELYPAFHSHNLPFHGPRCTPVR